MTRPRSNNARPNDKQRRDRSAFGAACCRLLGLTLLASSAGCLDALPGKPDAADRYQRPDTVLDFAALYGRRCSGCHGADGQMGPAPPLNDPLLLAICADADLKRTIEFGREGTPMPAFAKEQGGPLTDKQINAIVAGLRAKWGAESDHFEPPLPEYRLPQSPGNGRPAGNVSAGLEKFSLYCADCHGDDGQGGDTAGPLNDDAFLATISDQALRRIVITGRPDLGMPNYREIGESSEQSAPLSPEDIADLVALMASWRAEPLAPNR